MELSRIVFLWIGFVVLTLFFFYAAIFNAFVFWNEWIARKKAPSVVPIFGGVAGFFAIGLFGQIFHIDYKGNAPAWAWWVAASPLVLDYGCLPYLLLGVLYSIWSFISGIFRKKA